MKLTMDGEPQTPGLEVTVGVPKYNEDLMGNGDMLRLQSVGPDFVQLGYGDPVRISDLYRALAIISGTNEKVS